MSKVKALSATKVKALRPKKNKYTVSDGENLYLRVMPTGKKVWEVIDNRGLRRKTKVIGRYPGMSLSGAREARDRYFSDHVGANMRFGELVEAYFNHRKDELDPKYVRDIKAMIERDLYDIKTMRLTDILPTHLIKAFDRMNDRGIKVASKKMGSQLNRIFKYAATKQLISRNPMASIDLNILLKKHTPKNFAHITDEKLFKELLCAIDAYVGDANTKAALRLMPYCFVRPSNLREMKWEEIDIKGSVWVIPAKKMKTKKEHIVPLTPSMIAIIEGQRDNASPYVFPSPQSRSRPLSDNTLNVALKRMGFGEHMTSHGFRHTASTMLNEHRKDHGIGAHVIEAQLAHTVPGVAGVYNKANYMQERRTLMQWWSNFIDALQESCEEGR